MTKFVDLECPLSPLSLRLKGKEDGWRVEEVSGGDGRRGGRG